MNRDHARNLLPIIQAFADGKQIQKGEQPTKGVFINWKDVDSIDVVFPDYYYRVKPEPAKVYVTYRSNGTPSATHYTKEEADNYRQSVNNTAALTHNQPYITKTFIEQL